MLWGLGCVDVLKWWKYYSSSCIFVFWHLSILIIHSTTVEMVKKKKDSSLEAILLWMSVFKLWKLDPQPFYSPSASLSYILEKQSLWDSDETYTKVVCLWSSPCPRYTCTSIYICVCTYISLVRNWAGVTQDLHETHFHVEQQQRPVWDDRMCQMTGCP